MSLPKLSFLSDIRFREDPVSTETRKCNCEKHGEYDAKYYVYSDNSSWTEDVCPECEQQRIKDIEEAEKIAEYNKKINHCKKCNVELEYYDKSLEDYIPVTESQKKAKETVEKVLNGELNKLVLLGTNGTGKTMLGSIIAKEKNGKIYSMYEITTMIRQSYTVKAEKSELEIVQELASIPFLAIDEMGRTKGSQAELNWLSYILDKRHVRKLPFMIMTNGHLRRECKDNGCEKCFENYMDKDIISRLRQDSELINISGPDYRMKKY